MKIHPESLTNIFSHSNFYLRSLPWRSWGDLLVENFSMEDMLTGTNATTMLSSSSALKAKLFALKIHGPHHRKPQLDTVQRPKD